MRRSLKKLDQKSGENSLIGFDRVLLPAAGLIGSHLVDELMARR